MKILTRLSMFLKNKRLTIQPTQLSSEKIFKLIEPNTEMVVVAPWNGKSIPVTIRMLDNVALASCGDFNTITSIVKEAEEKEDFDLKKMVEVKNIHENILKLALVHPTFKEFETYLMGKDFYKNMKHEIAELEEQIESLTSIEEKQELMKELDLLEISIAFLLPIDFTTYIVTIIMQTEVTDIHRLTKNTLLQAGFLGEKYNVRPSDYLQGTFTEKQKIDIDVTALTLVSDYRQQQEIEKNGMKWIRGSK